MAPTKDDDEDNVPVAIILLGGTLATILIIVVIAIIIVRFKYDSTPVARPQQGTLVINRPPRPEYRMPSPARVVIDNRPDFPETPAAKERPWVAYNIPKPRYVSREPMPIAAAIEPAPGYTVPPPRPVPVQQKPKKLRKSVADMAQQTAAPRTVQLRAPQTIPTFNTIQKVYLRFTSYQSGVLAAIKTNADLGTLYDHLAAKSRLFANAQHDINQHAPNIYIDDIDPSAPVRDLILNTIEANDRLYDAMTILEKHNKGHVIDNWAAIVHGVVLKRYLTWAAMPTINTEDDAVNDKVRDAAKQMSLVAAQALLAPSLIFVYDTLHKCPIDYDDENFAITVASVVGRLYEWMCRNADDYKSYTEASMVLKRRNEINSDALTYCRELSALNANWRGKRSYRTKWLNLFIDKVQNRFYPEIGFFGGLFKPTLQIRDMLR